MLPFLIIGLAGLALLGVSLLVGDLLDGVGDVLPGDVFSTAVIGGFVSAFGFGAAIAESLDVALPVTIGVGIVAGVIFGWFAAWLTRIIRGGSTDTPPAAHDALGREALVLTAIPADGFGVVKVTIGGQARRFNARAEMSVEPGTEVFVNGILSPTAVSVALVRPHLELPPS